MKTATTLLRRSPVELAKIRKAYSAQFKRALRKFSLGIYKVSIR